VADNALGLLSGVVACLRAHADVTALVDERTYSDVPQQTTFPYCEVSIESTPYDWADASGMQHKVRVQSYSRTQGQKEALQIRQAIYNALHRQEGAVAVLGGALVRMNAGTLLDCFKEPDGVTWQSVIEFDAVVT
jgi:hypothetical protein